MVHLLRSYVLGMSVSPTLEQTSGVPFRLYRYRSASSGRPCPR